MAGGLRLGKPELARCFAPLQSSSAHWFLLPFPLSHAFLFPYLNLFFFLRRENQEPQEPRY